MNVKAEIFTAIISRLWITNILTEPKHIGQTDRTKLKFV
jgi:hypothetical protein